MWEKGISLRPGSYEYIITAAANDKEIKSLVNKMKRTLKKEYDKLGRKRRKVC